MLQHTLTWFEKAVPYPTAKNQHTQLGVHFEEVKELVQTLTSADVETCYLLARAEDALENLAQHLKAKDNVVFIKPEDRVSFLDALCDQMVTLTGSAHMYRLDLLGGLEEVNRSNWSKFVDGKPVFDENRKIQKGPSYFKADLSRFVPAA